MKRNSGMNKIILSVAVVGLAWGELRLSLKTTQVLHRIATRFIRRLSLPRMPAPIL